MKNILILMLLISFNCSSKEWQNIYLNENVSLMDLNLFYANIELDKYPEVNTKQIYVKNTDEFDFVDDFQYLVDFPTEIIRKHAYYDVNDKKIKIEITIYYAVSKKSRNIDAFKTNLKNTKRNIKNACVFYLNDISNNKYIFPRIDHYGYDTPKTKYLKKLDIEDDIEYIVNVNTRTNADTYIKNLLTCKTKYTEIYNRIKNLEFKYSKEWYEF